MRVWTNAQEKPKRKEGAEAEGECRAKGERQGLLRDRERNLGRIRERNPGEIREQSWFEFGRNSRGILAVFAADFGGVSAVFGRTSGRVSAGLRHLIKFLHKSGSSPPRSGNGNVSL